MKAKLILVVLILVLASPVAFLILRKNSSPKPQELSTKRPLEKRTGGFTPLIKKHLENVKQEKEGEGFEDGENSASQRDSQAPDFSLKNLKDKIITLKSLQGKNVLLLFWATTCGWCAYEKNDLIRFTNEQKGNVEVIAVINEPKDQVLEYVKREGINFTVLLDKNGETFTKYQALGTPVHVLINKEGKIVKWQPGATDYQGLLWLLGRFEK